MRESPKLLLNIIRQNIINISKYTSVADDIGATSGTLLNLIKKNKVGYFGYMKIHQTHEKLILEGKV